MEIKKILQEIKGELPDKISIKQRGDSRQVRRLILADINKQCLFNSDGKRGLQLDSETERAIELICQYLNKEESFLKNDGFALSKGLWICGNFGSGKTQLLKAYKSVAMQMFNQNVGIQSCADMNARYLKRNDMTRQLALFDGIKTFSNKFDTQERIFDDLGEEETYVMDYGNKVCLMAHILSERYKGLKSGAITHITTNLSMKQVAEIYGGRIESRISEMFNVIKLGSRADSKDYRK
jgi:DNA replication protein DnaC